MPDFKTLLSIIVVALTFVGYIPYVRDIFRGKTTPHTFTWFIWFLATAIAYGLQVSKGAGVGSWVTLAVAVISFFIFILGLAKKNKDIASSDIIFITLALIALFLWLVVKQPVLSVILIVSVDVLGFVPTIRKSWNSPYSETLFSYALNVFRHGLSVLALQEYNIVTWLYPVAWTAANLIFVIILVIRRKKVPLVAMSEQ